MQIYHLKPEDMLLNILLLSLLFPFCISNADIISQNETITDPNLIVSGKGYFALGFFSPGKSSYRYLGIWYHKLPGKTVVWVANRDNPINDSSGFVSLNSDGNLVLCNNHSEQLPLWSTNVSVKGTEGFVAQLQDSGNLVIIQKESKRIVWQSFDYPTDTLLPGMKLGLDMKLALNRALTSWRSQDDPGTGEWLYQVVPTGCPQFILFHKGFSLTRYWRTAPWPWDTPELHDGVASYANNQDEIYYAFIPNDESVFTRLVATSSGFIQRSTWDNSSLQWMESPPEPKYRYGHCGPYSLINRNSVDSLECMCLPGYTPKSLKNWYLRDGSAGCTREVSQQTMCRNGEGFAKVDSVKIPDTSIAALMDRNFSSSKCRHLCLSNCSCKAFAMLNIDGKGLGCVTWYGELMDTMLLSMGRDLYIRVDAITLAEFESKKSYFLRKKGMLAILVSSAALTMFLIVLCTYLWVRKKSKEKVKRKGLISALMENELVGSMQPADLPIFDLQSISAATNNFSPANKLGQGGFGSVYKGQLEDGQDIAVKRLSQTSGQGIAEFKNELVLIARLQHRNLVRLLGCCIEGQEQMLIYEYLPNKSLDYFIFDHTRRPMLDWTKRFDIIIGIARGVMYLHHDSRLRIVHRDLKTSNVLLDADMNPKISDFGMARIFKGNEVQDNTNRVAGTFGYMAPEYVIFGKFSTKSDVFSFGVIMLEIISGKKSNTCEADDQASNLIGHVWDLWKEGRVSDIVDSSLRASSVPPEIFRCIHVGLLCVEEDITGRPTMPTVVLMLNGETTLPSPKQPAFILTRNQNVTNPFAAAGMSSVNEVTISEAEAR